MRSSLPEVIIGNESVEAGAQAGTLTPLCVCVCGGVLKEPMPAPERALVILTSFRTGAGTPCHRGGDRFRDRVGAGCVCRWL